MTTSAVGGHHRRSDWWLGPAERQSPKAYGVGQWVNHSTNEWSNDQSYRLPLRHGCSVKQRVDNGHLTVISHRGQQEAFCGDEHPKKQMLHYAGREGDGLPHN